MKRAGGSSYKNTKERQWLAKHDKEISEKLKKLEKK